MLHRIKYIQRLKSIYYDITNKGYKKWKQQLIKC